MADITTEEIIKIIMAVLGIVVLFSLLTSLYGIFTQRTDAEAAKSTLEQITGQLENLEKIPRENIKLLEGETREILYTNPLNWKLFIEENKKELCLCPQGDNCDIEKVCKDFDVRLKLMDATESIKVINFNEIKNLYIGKFVDVKDDEFTYTISEVEGPLTK